MLYLGELAIRIPGAGCSTSLLLLCWELGMRVEWSTRTLVLVQETHRKRVQSMFSVLRCPFGSMIITEAFPVLNNDGLNSSKRNSPRQSGDLPFLSSFLFFYLFFLIIAAPFLFDGVKFGRSSMGSTP